MKKALNNSDLFLDSTAYTGISAIQQIPPHLRIYGGGSDLKLKGLLATILFILVSILSLMPLRAEDMNSASKESAKAGGNKGMSDDTSFTLSSSAFDHEKLIPPKYTCDGENTSPPLEWANVPDKSKSFALICDDPDAPAQTWVHWIIYNIPADYRELSDSVKSGREIEAGIHQGTNSWGDISYGGPCPPSGTHRYFFKLYALDSKLDLEGLVDEERLLKEMEGHILAQTQLMGKYSRRK